MGVDEEVVFSPQSMRVYAVSIPDDIERVLSEPVVCNTFDGHVCMFGVGNSSIAGDIMQQYLDESSDSYIPMVSGDLVPGWMGEGDHAIILSYSGDSAEMVRCYRSLRERGCIIHCITSGGELSAMCIEDGQHLYKVPGDIPSRCSLGYMLAHLSVIIQSLGIVDACDQLRDRVEEVRSYLGSSSLSDSVESIACSMVGTIPAVYATPDMLPIAKRWRQGLYQMCGMLSFYGDLPEFDHNEIVGWGYPNAHSPRLTMFALRGPRESELINIIVDTMADTLVEFGRDVHTIRLEMEDTLVRNICGCILGDLVTARIKELMSS